MNFAKCVLLAAVCTGLASGCDCGGEMGDLDSGLADAADTGMALDAGVDSGTDSGPPECVAAADCDRFGAPPCGTWECNANSCEVICPGCTDVDRDGYGVGTCAGPDCDDADDTIGADTIRSCYTGPSGTAGTGVCAAGTKSCVAGVWSPCTGEVTPTAEACNNEDEDCDATVDEDLPDSSCGVGACARSMASCGAGAIVMCMPGPAAANDQSCDGIDSDCDGAIDEDCPNCVTVAPGGNDATAVGNDNASPFGTIQAAIDWAADPSAPSPRPTIVCVAAGTGCGVSYAYAGAVRMANGISVRGNYESTNFTTCSGSTTTIQPGVDRGVVFPSTVSAPTSLDSFYIERSASSSTATIAGVTIDGATGAVVSRVVIETAPTADRSYGINLINGAVATITQSSIFAGEGSIESFGVRSVESAPRIIANCERYDGAGRCDDYCGAVPRRAIRGRFTTGSGETAAILLDDSPGATVETSAICGNDGDEGSGVRIRNDATGVIVRGNLINAWGGLDDSHGVWMTDCAGAAPWIVDNFMIAAAGDNDSTRVDGVRAIGDCHPIVDANVRITGGAEGGTTGANGVHCASNGTVASRCAVLGNLLIEGSSTGFPPTAVGVRCADRSCVRVAHNSMTGRGGEESWGLVLENTGAFVDDNDIRGGCASMNSYGVYSDNSYARLQNNRIFGGTCVGAVTNARTYGLWAIGATVGVELDVHSNVIDGQGGAGCPSGAGIVLDASGSGGSFGIYRNNIILPSVCTTAHGVLETSTSIDPRIFENNDLDITLSPDAAYLDEGTTPVADAAGVNLLTDAAFANNMSVDPQFVAYPSDVHLDASSMCLDRGTPVGAPSDDMDGDPRSTSAPDIGADER